MPLEKIHTPPFFGERFFETGGGLREREGAGVFIYDLGGMAPERRIGFRIPAAGRGGERPGWRAPPGGACESQ